MQPLPLKTHSRQGSSSTSSDLADLQNTRNPSLESADEPVQSAEGTVEDQLQKAGVCDSQGIVAGNFEDKRFSPILKETSLHDFIKTLIENTTISTASPSSDSKIFQELIMEMFQISLEEGTEYTLDGLKLVWPAAITEVRLSGDQHWLLLFKDIDYLQKQFDHIFSSSIPSQVIQDFLNDRKEKKVEDPSLITFEMVWKGSHGHFKSLVKKTLNFLRKDPNFLPDHYSFDETNSSIDIKCGNRTIRFVFSEKQTIRSSSDCLSILLFSLSNPGLRDESIVIDYYPLGHLELTSGPFSAAQVLMDELCLLYRPVSTPVSDALLDLHDEGNRRLSGREEKDLVKQFLNEYLSIDSEGAFKKALSYLKLDGNEKINQLAKRKTARFFASVQDEFLAKALYFHIQRKIESKKYNPLDCRAFEFFVRVSQSLLMHSSINDQVIDQLWQWCEEDSIFDHSNSPLQNSILQLSSTGKINFRELTVCLLPLYLILYPERFPFFFRSPTHRIEAFRKLNAYLKTPQGVENLKLICDSFVPRNGEERNSPTYFSRLEFGDLELTQEVICLLEHSDPVVSYLGLQASLMLPNLTHPLQLYVQIPKILSEERNKKNPKAVQTLFQKAKEMCGATLKEDPLSLDSWIKLLAQSQKRDFVHLACQMLQKNGNAKLESNLDMAKQLSIVDPRAAILFFTSLLKKNKDPNVTLSTALVLLRAYQKQFYLFSREDLKPIIDHFFQKGKAIKFIDETQRKSFCDVFCTFLTSLCHSFYEEEADRYLLESIKKKYVDRSDISPDLRDRLKKEIDMHGAIDTNLPFKETIQAFLGKEHHDEAETILLDTEQALLKNLPLVKEIEGWEDLFFNYLSSVEATSKRLPHLWKIYREAITGRTLNDSNLGVLVHLIDQSSGVPDLIPPVILKVIYDRRLEIIHLLQNGNRLNAAQYILSLSRGKDAQESLWKQCKYLLDSEEKPLRKILQLLQAASPDKLCKILKQDDFQPVQQLLNVLVEGYPRKIRYQENGKKSLLVTKGPTKKVLQGNARYMKGINRINKFIKNAIACQSSSEKVEKKTIQGIPQTYFDKRRAEYLPWIKSLLKYAVLPANRRQNVLKIQCSEVEWKEIIEALLPLESVHLSHFALCHLFPKSQLLGPAALKEFEQHINKAPSSADLNLCLSLIEGYFPLDCAKWNKLWKNLQKLKDRALIVRSWNIFQEKYEKIPSSDELELCWKNALTCLSAHAIDLTRFVESLPLFFDEPKRKELKTLILNQALEIGIDQLHRASLGGKKPKQKLMAEQEDMRGRLIKITEKQPLQSLEQYLKWLSVLSEATIEKHHKSCFDITLQVVKQFGTEEINSALEGYSEGYIKHFCKIMEIRFGEILHNKIEAKNETDPGEQRLQASLNGDESFALSAGNNAQNGSAVHQETILSDFLKGITEEYKKFFEALKWGAKTLTLDGPAKAKLGIALFEEYAKHPTDFINFTFKKQEKETEITLTPHEVLEIMRNRLNFLEVYGRFISFTACKEDRFKEYAGFAFDLVCLIYSDYRSMLGSPEYKEMATKDMNPIVAKSIEYLWALFPNVPADYLQFFFFRVHKNQKRVTSKSTQEQMDAIKPIEFDKTAKSDFRYQIKMKLVVALCKKLEEFQKKNAPGKKSKSEHIKTAGIKLKMKEKIAELIKPASEYEVNTFYKECSDWKELNTLLSAGWHYLKYAAKLNIFSEEQGWLITHLHLFSPLQSPPSILLCLTKEDYGKILYETVEQLLRYQTPFSHYCAAYKLGFLMRQGFRSSYDKLTVTFSRVVLAAIDNPKLLTPSQSLLEGVDKFCIREERNLNILSVSYGKSSCYNDLVRIQFESALEILDKNAGELDLHSKIHYLNLAFSFFFDLLRTKHFNLEDYAPFSGCLTTYAFEIEEEIEKARKSPLSGATLPKCGMFIKKCTAFKLDRSLVSFLVSSKDTFNQWYLDMVPEWLNLLKERIGKFEGYCPFLDVLSEIVLRRYLSEDDPQQSEIYDSFKPWINEHPLTEEQAVFFELLNLTFHLSTHLKNENQEAYAALFISLCEKLEQSGISSDKVTTVFELLEKHIERFKGMPSEAIKKAYHVFLRMSLAQAKKADDDLSKYYYEKIYRYLRRGVVDRLFLPDESPNKDAVFETFDALKSWMKKDPDYAILFEIIEIAFHTVLLEKTNRSKEITVRFKNFQPGLGEYLKKKKTRTILDEIHSLLKDLNLADSIENFKNKVS